MFLNKNLLDFVPTCFEKNKSELFTQILKMCPSGTCLNFHVLRFLRSGCYCFTCQYQNVGN